MAVYQDKNTKKWYVKLRINGKSTTKRGFKNKTLAKRYEEKMRWEFQENDGIKVKKVLYSYMANEYMLDLQTNQKYSTYKKCYNNFKNFIFPNFEDKPIDEITENDCRIFKNKVKELDLSVNTKKYIIQKFKKIFTYAIEEHRLINNPARNITTKFEDVERFDYHTLTMDEIKLLISKIKESDYRGLFMMLGYTGMREGEALALSWNDWDGKLMRICKTQTTKPEKYKYGRKEGITTPKNKYSIRTIPLPKIINDYLKNYKVMEKRKPGFNEEWFIFGGERPLPRTTVRRKMVKALTDAELKIIRVHDLRHSYITHMIQSQAMINAVSKYVGHKDITTTLKIYTHNTKDSDENLLNIINSQL